MNASSDDSAFDWIANGRSLNPGVYAATGVPLSRVIPLAFPRYAKVFHRLDGFYGNIDRPLSSEEITLLGIPSCTAIRELVSQKRALNLGSRISWKDAAKALGVPYTSELTHSWFSQSLRPHPECWPRFIYGPADGTLQEGECRELASLLKAVTPTGDCHFRLPEIPFIAADQDLLFIGGLHEVETHFLQGGFHTTPEYWWPSDHSWCVCSEYDLTFTIVAGSASLIDSLLESDVLECLEFSSEKRIDNMVPIPGIA